MKFSHKLILSSILTIAIVFSLGGGIMLIQNHEHLLHRTIDQYVDNHMIECFSLESRLIQDSLGETTAYGRDDTLMNHRALAYVKQYATIRNQTNASYILYDRNHHPLYTDMAHSLVQHFDPEDTKNYSIITHQNQTYLQLTSSVTAGNMTYYLGTSYDISSVYAERTRQFQSFIIIDGCILIISFLILHFLSRYLTSPIKQLNEASQHIANGNYEKRTGIHTNDEIGELSKSFDEMAAAVEANIAQLKDYAASREEFMGSFSHEIKTPMTAILGFADMLRTLDCDEETRHRAASYIYEEGKRLEKLSHTLMDLLALQEQKLDLIHCSMQDILQALQHYYEGASLSIQLRFLCEEAIVRSHPELLFTLLRNLIDNAIKASDEGSIVLIKGVVYDNRYQCSIIDEGIGMKEADIHKAMEPFYMADKSRARSHGGAGLGLSIVKRILELHDTTLTIASKEKEGTTVSFMLEVIKDES